MADSFHSLYYHFVWSTKNRERWITADIESRVWEYLAGIALQKSMTPVCIGGFDDHIHALVRFPPTLDVSRAIQFLKGPSSKWFHQAFPMKLGFAWQDGYGAFSVSKSNIPGVVDYIKSQREHHRVRTFQDEFLEFLHRHEIEYKEQYLWD